MPAAHRRFKIPPRRGSAYHTIPITVGAFGDILEVTDEDFVTFSAQVDQLNADVNGELKKLPALDKLSANQQAFAQWHLVQWLPWSGEWTLWAGTHQDGLSRLSASSGVEFAAFKSKWNLLLQDFVAFGGQTGLSPVDVVAPPEPEEDTDWSFGLGLGLGAATPVVIGGGLLLAFLALRPYLK